MWAFDQFTNKHKKFLKKYLSWPTNNKVDPNYTFSINWSGGGTMGSCWDNKLRQIDSEIEPQFSIFDEMLLKFCPVISRQQYQIIYDRVVKTIDYLDRDYYEGCQKKFEKSFSLIDLFNILLEMELL